MFFRLFFNHASSDVISIYQYIYLGLETLKIHKYASEHKIKGITTSKRKKYNVLAVYLIKIT